MGVYVVLVAALCIAAAKEIDLKQNVVLEGKYRSVTLHIEVCIPMLMFLFLGVFRETDVGYDSYNYYMNYWGKVDFLSWKQLLSDFSIDNGFYLILKIISLYTEDWWLARAWLFAITFILYYYIIRKYSPYPSVSLIIFLGIGMLGLTFGILRQALAGAVTMLAYNQIRKGSWFKCLLYILLASTIHKTAVLCIYLLVLYFMNKKNFSTMKVIMISVSVYGLVFIAIPVLITFYRDGFHYQNIASNGGYGKLWFIIFVIALIMHLFRLTKPLQDSELSYLFNLSCATLFVQIGALQWSLITRTTTFFSVYWCILIPELIRRLQRHERFRYVAVVATLFGFMFFYQIAEVERFVMHKF